MAILLALASAVLFGAMTVAIRVGFARGADARVASLSMTAVALGVCAVAAAALPNDGETGFGALWPFALAGVLAPGVSQILFARAISETGASRASVVVGTAPLVSVAIALGILGEPPKAALLAGAALIVAGGLALASEPERSRPESFRRLGLLFAAVATVVFSVRDSLVRWLTGERHAAPLPAATLTLLAGLVVMAIATAAVRGDARAGRVRDGLRSFAPAGLLLGISYVTLFEAYARGRLTVVSPLVATESLWGVGLSAVLLHRTELVGRRLLAGAVLVVAGGILIGTGA